MRACPNHSGFRNYATLIGRRSTDLLVFGALPCRYAMQICHAEVAKHAEMNPFKEKTHASGTIFNE